MDEGKIFEELEKSGALKKGHFRLSSGLHSDTYIQCALLLADPSRALEVGRSIAQKIDEEVDLVLSPALGGIVVGFATALALGCPMMFAERVEGGMELRRGFEIARGSRVLLVEDVITTGGSVMELAGIAEAAGASVAAIACIVDRGGFDQEDYTFDSLIRLDIESYSPEDCPQCRAGEEVTAPGSRYVV
ncbi:MAG: orotate phosphoribosyltransferase [Actinobacteria bacterium]|nr:orotate phosphoribosyltransferase [Actinomycetota bacterium]